ncbi:MAG: glycoside hydrolase family 65 protein [Anaerolineae bacterium]|nr:glycoside hydrolase family 65 protein [Anaerolineae bacterium]
MSNNFIVENNFLSEELQYKETVFTMGNGYLGTRGTFEEGYPNENAATLVNGVFDDIPIVYTELVNAPNWIQLTVFIEGERFRMDRGKVLEYRRKLNLKNGVLSRHIRWQSPAGHTVDIVFERFASMAQEHVLAVRCQVTPVDFSGQVVIQAGLPGHVDNDGWLHWKFLDQGQMPEGAFIEVQTKKTAHMLVEACSLRTDDAMAVYAYQDCHWCPTLVASSELALGQTLTADKLVTIYTSRDVESPRQTAIEALQEVQAQGYEALREANTAAWAEVWEASNIVIEGDAAADLALRYSLFQLLIAAPRHDDRVSIPAKSLSGFGYRGHAFWDTEIFMLPFFIYTQPETARRLLLYRYHTLGGARRKAQAEGYEGAMYAWESAGTGDETTPKWVPLPNGELIRIWCGDIELHISADIAYSVLLHWQVTGDDAFMRDYGAEIILETARFWGSRAEWVADLDRYEISDVIGPDEYHDHVDNNAYTNEMARWNLRAALDVLEWLETSAPDKLAQLITALDLTSERLAHWEVVINKLYVGYNPETRLFEQFDGFFKRKGVDLADYEPRTESMQALLGVEGAQEYQVLKQPDVLMLLYLHEADYDQATLQANWDYYTPRTDLSYGSSLGPAIQAALAARMQDLEAAYHHFIHAARTDLQDVRGNTSDGIHAATNGGLWQAVIFGFAGLRFTGAGPVVNPRLPEGWTRLKFRVCHRGRWYDFDLSATQ